MNKNDADEKWCPIRLKGLSGVASIGLNQLWVMYWTISAIGAVIEVCKYHLLPPSKTRPSSWPRS